VGCDYPSGRELLFAIGTAVAVAFDQDWLGMVQETLLKAIARRNSREPFIGSSVNLTLQKQPFACLS
jgi:hypothetical protein